MFSYFTLVYVFIYRMEYNYSCSGPCFFLVMWAPGKLPLSCNFQTFERLNIIFYNYGASINGGLYD